MSERLDRDQLVAALTALGAVLSARGVKGQVFIVGGAAMVLAFNTREATRDIDAVFEPKMAVYEAAREVARQLGLPDDWLNDGVKAFLPALPHTASSSLSLDGLDVTTASADYLLVMKLLASRVGEDEEDIRWLLRACGITRVEDAIRRVTEAYPGRPIAAKTRFMLEEMLGPSSV